MASERWHERCSEIGAKIATTSLALRWCAQRSEIGMGSSRNWGLFAETREDSQKNVARLIPTSDNQEMGYILNAISAEFGVTFIADQEEAGMFLAGELAWTKQRHQLEIESGPVR
jgi:hypothetical protein